VYKQLFILDPVVKVMLPTCRPNLAEVYCAIQKVNQTCCARL